MVVPVVVGLFFIRDIVVLVLYLLGGWVLVAILTGAVIKFAAAYFTDDVTSADALDDDAQKIVTPVKGA